MAGIYKLTAPNGKCYIGQSVDLDRRLRDYANRVVKGQRHLYNAVKKYGWDNFKVEILWRTKHPERYRNLSVLLDTLEIAWIKKFDSVANGYNLQYGGSSGRPSKETRLKRSKKVKQYDMEGKLIREWPSIQDAADFLGATHNSISRVCRKINNTSAGFRWAYAADQLAELKNKKPVKQYSLGGNLIKTWESAKEAQRETGVGSGNIHQVCRGKRRSAGGFKWRYLSDGIEELEPVKNKERYLAVEQYTQEGKLVKTWESAKEAGREIGVHSGSIHKVCRGEYRTAGGFKWKYA